ncbi:MAG: membrane protein insertion efficiency factor YidD [Candidatus Cloacimonetes bacterium]|nr:membrane protein insertion efficiency factor YidD [Candidatus Cloacimonadota bacterium]
MKVLNQAVLLLIFLYKKILSPMLPPACRFTPTCSEYSRQAFLKYSFPKALKLSVLRLLRCHPLHHGGYDPLP